MSDKERSHDFCPVSFITPDPCRGVTVHCHPVLFPVASTAGHHVAAPQAAPAVLSEQDATAAQVAGMTTQAAGMLQSGMNSRQAAEMARGYATSTAQSAFQSG